MFMIEEQPPMLKARESRGRVTGEGLRFPGDDDLPFTDITPRILEVPAGRVEKREFLARLGCELTPQARALISHLDFEIDDRPEAVKFIILSAKDLGFEYSPATDEFMTAKYCWQWSQTNLAGFIIGMCEPKDALEIRYWYRRQPRGEDLFVVAYPVEEEMGGNGQVFHIKRNGAGDAEDDRRFLHVRSAKSSDHLWRIGKDKFLFRLIGRRKPNLGFRAPEPNFSRHTHYFMGWRRELGVGGSRMS